MPSFIWTLPSAVILFFPSCWPHASAIGDTCLLASGSFVQHHCAIWCTRCTGKVFLCGASRQPPSLWNCISNILFRALTGHISIAHSYHSSPAASRDSSKWSQKPQWHPAFFFFIEKPLSFRRESSLSDIVAWAGLRGAEGAEAVLSVSSGPTISQLTYNAQINCTFLNSPTFPPFKKDCLYVGQSVLLFYRYMNSQHIV